MRRARFGFNIRAFRHLPPSSSVLRRTRQTPEIFPAKWQRVASYSRVNRNDSFPRLFLEETGAVSTAAAIILSSHINHILTHFASRIACTRRKEQESRVKPTITSNILRGVSSGFFPRPPPLVEEYNNIIYKSTIKIDKCRFQVNIVL